jgi:hypothetical protein
MEDKSLGVRWFTLHGMHDSRQNCIRLSEVDGYWGCAVVMLSRFGRRLMERPRLQKVESREQMVSLSKRPKGNRKEDSIFTIAAPLSRITTPYIEIKTTGGQLCETIELGIFSQSWPKRLYPSDSSALIGSTKPLMPTVACRRVRTLSRSIEKIPIPCRNPK